MSRLVAMDSGCDVESTDELLLHDSPPAGRFPSRKRGAVAVLAALAMFAAAALWQRPQILGKVNPGRLVGFSSDDFEVFADKDLGKEDMSDACQKHMPFIMIDKVISSNLGKQGPDKDAAEGIIYKVKTHNLGSHLDGVHLEIHVHSITNFSDENSDYDSNYVPAFKKGDFQNGVHGKFACINIKQNTSLKLRAHAYDADAKKDLELPHAVVSFFDIDSGKQGNHSVEHVYVGGYSAVFLSNDTEVHYEHKDDFARFTATKEGTGDDNPEDPMHLTPQQKNKAVTVEFRNMKHFDFEIGATAGYTSRVFSFVFRPSLLCADTEVKKHEYPATGAKSPVHPVTKDKNVAMKGAPSAAAAVGFVSILLQFFM